MRIDPHQRRRAVLTLDGVALTAAENRAAGELARTLTSVPLPELALIRTALQHEIRRLEAAAEWTQGEPEEQRRELFERAVLTYRAAELAAATLTDLAQQRRQA